MQTLADGKTTTAARLVWTIGWGIGKLGNDTLRDESIATMLKKPNNLSSKKIYNCFVLFVRAAFATPLAT